MIEELKKVRAALNSYAHVPSDPAGQRRKAHWYEVIDAGENAREALATLDRLIAGCEGRKVDSAELRSACMNFFDSWFGPSIGAPEHLERIQARREKSKRDFADLLYRFVRTWQRTTPQPADSGIAEQEAIQQAAVDESGVMHLIQKAFHDANVYGKDDTPMSVERRAWESVLITLRPYLRTTPQPTADVPEKLHNQMLAHLDGVYVFSARKDCDELVSQVIQLVLGKQSTADVLAMLDSAGAVDSLGKALFLSEYPTSDWGKLHYSQRERWRAFAKAAIAAIKQLAKER